MSSSSLSVSFKAKTKSKKSAKATKLAARFLEWEENVQEWRQKLWGWRYAERMGTTWEGSRELVTERADICLGDYAESEKLHISNLYASQYHCRRCKNLNDSKYKPYCTACTDLWKANSAKKKKNDLKALICSHLSKVDTLELSDSD